VGALDRKMKCEKEGKRRGGVNGNSSEGTRERENREQVGTAKTGGRLGDSRTKEYGGSSRCGRKEERRLRVWSEKERICGITRTQLTHNRGKLQ